MTQDREVGIVKSTTSRGFGFIRRKWDEHGKPREDLFFHASQCNNEFENMRPGTKVSYDIGEDKTGRQEAMVVMVAC